MSKLIVLEDNNVAGHFKLAQVPGPGALPSPCPTVCPNPAPNDPFNTFPFNIYIHLSNQLLVIEGGPSFPFVNCRIDPFIGNWPVGGVIRCTKTLVPPGGDCMSGQGTDPDSCVWCFDGGPPDLCTVLSQQKIYCDTNFWIFVLGEEDIAIPEGFRWYVVYIKPNILTPVGFSPLGQYQRFGDPAIFDPAIDSVFAPQTAIVNTFPNP